MAYANDWGALVQYAQGFGPPGDAQKLTLSLCANHDWLYLLAIVRDTTRTRVDASDPRAPTSTTISP